MHVIEIGLGFVMSTLMLSLSLMMMRKTPFWKLFGLARRAFGGLLEQVFRALDSCLALFGASSGFVERPSRFLKDVGMILASKINQIWI